MLSNLTTPSRPIRSVTAASAALAAGCAVLTASASTGAAFAASASLKNNGLSDVVVAPGGTAWAIGGYSSSSGLTKSYILRWNGTAWRFVPSPEVGGATASDNLVGLAAATSSSIWAVGFVKTTTSIRSLILHWNGKSWSQVASPSPGGSSGSTYLASVTAASASSAWAVGYYYGPGTGNGARTLILHWNGRSWRQVASPTPGGKTGYGFLDGVAAGSRSSAWAVGSYVTGGVRRTLAVHWNGRDWKQVPSPNPGGASQDNGLMGVAVASATNVWTVGSYSKGTDYFTLIAHWNGKTWKSEATPNGPATGHYLLGVAALSPSVALAVGYYGNGVTSQSLAERWNGRSWKIVSSASPGGIFGTTLLVGIAAVSATSAWAVGYYASSVRRTLILRWNGRAWKRVPSPNR